MAITNRERVGKGLELLRAGLKSYMEQQFRAKFGPSWQDIVAARFEFRRQADGDLHLDNQFLLKLFIIPEVWRELLEPVLGKATRSYAGELVDVRNRHAHDEAFTSDQTERALDTMRLLLVEVGAPDEAEQVAQLRYDLQRQVFAEQTRQKTRTATLIDGSPKAGLRPWREVVTPHQDVISGRYVQAEFAADLHNVHHGIGGAEYTDPAEFYRRTFITDGIRELLAGGLERLSGMGGDPVVELQTNFGGGKTHAMLALYHLFGGTATTDLAGLEPILKAVGVERAPKARRAVLVGTHLSVGQVADKPDGTKVHTLWGELAWQLAGAEGYALVAESDKKGVSPGAKVLTDLFNRCAPCLVLIDEWVAYARNTVDRRDLPSGDFEAQATFAQALTEAAKAADKTLVVASIPASDIEVGGTNGRHALAVLKNVFERVGKTWRPASADEGFEIVRRRLFETIRDREKFVARDAVVEGFSRLYLENKAEFPSGVAEGAYKRKLENAYPLHPDVFDQLYGEWSTLDKFQRTRGVLRLLAKVIHRLWESNDAGLLILPASVPMDDPAVKSELTRYIEDVWEPIISEDVDGPNALPLELDRANPNLGRVSACRRVARTLYLGTAPGSAGKNPGIDDRRVRLGCTQPGEHAATFGDALRRISDKAKHIHQDGNRYWISTKANLNRLADDRANTLLGEPERLHVELVRRIREECKQKPNRGDFAGVHPCPESTSEVHDEPEARLVILGPEYPHRKGQTDTAAMKYARSLLDQRGNSPRLNRNMVVFLVADAAPPGGPTSRDRPASSLEIHLRGTRSPQPRQLPAQAGRDEDQGDGRHGRRPHPGDVDARSGARPQRRAGRRPGAARGVGRPRRDPHPGQRPPGQAHLEEAPHRRPASPRSGRHDPPAPPRHLAVEGQAARHGGPVGRVVRPLHLPAPHHQPRHGARRSPRRTDHGQPPGGRHLRLRRRLRRGHRPLQGAATQDFDRRPGGGLAGRQDGGGPGPDRRRRGGGTSPQGRPGSRQDRRRRLGRHGDPDGHPDGQGGRSRRPDGGHAAAGRRPPGAEEAVGLRGLGQARRQPPWQGRRQDRRGSPPAPLDPAGRRRGGHPGDPHPRPRRRRRRRGADGQRERPDAEVHQRGVRDGVVGPGRFLGPSSTDRGCRPREAYR